MENKNPFLYRVSQFVGFLLGARFFMAALLTFALYVSTFFLFAHEESLRSFVFDLRVHVIIGCAVLSILAGGIINQFYDKEKDELAKPFRTRLQSFLKQKYFLYVYLLLVVISLTVAYFLSYRVFIFFAIYQFMMWFYSHKLSKILILNNLCFVALSFYPFFGMLVYYQTFSFNIMWMAMFLFFILLAVDIVKDILTQTADKVYGYETLATRYGTSVTSKISQGIFLILMALSFIIARNLMFEGILAYYYVLGILLLLFCFLFLMSRNERKFYIILTTLRLWIFFGIIAMLANGIDLRY